MFSFTNTHFRYDEFLLHLGDKLNTPVINNRLVLPDAIGKGYLQAAELPNGLWVLFQDVMLHADVTLERPAFESEEFYTLRFEEVDIEQKMVTMIDGEYHREQDGNGNFIFLTCSLHDLEFVFTKGTSFHSIHVRLPKEWLAKYFKMDTYDRILEEYLSLKTEAMTIEPLDGEYKMVLAEIRSLNEDHPAHKAIILNRVMYMMERFFTSLYEKRFQLKSHIHTNSNDIAHLREVELAITKDFSEPCPTINELARLASMSPSKLKHLFKTVYGKPIYQYYQHHRMMKAKSLLLTKQFSIKEIGMNLGYANLSNFSTAFKKEFGILPSDLLKSTVS